MKTQRLLVLAPVLLTTLLARCSQVPGDGLPGDSSSSSSGGGGTSSGGGPITGEPLNGTGQTLVGGSRLKVQYILGADGSKQLVGFRDTVMNFGCSFYPAVGGGAVCVPVNGGGSLFTNLFPRTSYAFYALDSACMDLVAVASPGPSAALEYLLDVDIAGALAGGTYAVRGLYRAQPLTVTTDGGTLTLYSALSGTCTATALPANYTVFRRGEEVPLSSLAQGQPMVEP